MGYEVVYDKESCFIVLTREITAPRDDLVPVEGQEKLFLGDFDFGNLPLSAFQVDSKRRTLVRRKDFLAPEADVEISLSCDATNRSLIGSIPAIPADGKSTTTIRVHKISTGTGSPLRAARHNNRLNIRTTAGALSALQVDLEKGRASFTLRSSTDTVVAEVRVWSEEIPQPGVIRIEFAPVS